MKKLSSNPFAATDLCIFRFVEGELNVYLVKLKHSYYKGQWALPGALVSGDEDLNQAAKRVYKEATGNTNLLLEQLHTFSNPQRDPRTRSISTAFLTFPKGKILSFAPCDKYEEGQWMEVSQIKELAYDHSKIISKALQRISSKLNYTTIGLLLLPEKFTLSDLQEVYEYFLKNKIDKRNFRKRILSFDILKDTGEMLTGLKARPAKLYSAKQREIITLPMFN